MSGAVTMTEVLVIGSNLLLTGATVILAFVTFKDVNEEEQKTIRELIRRIPIVGLVSRPAVEQEQDDADYEESLREEQEAA